MIHVKIPQARIAGPRPHAIVRADNINRIAAILETPIEIPPIAGVPAASFGDGIADRHDPGERPVLKVQRVNRAARLRTSEYDIQIVNAVRRSVDVGVLHDHFAIATGRLCLHGLQQEAGR